MSSPTPTKRPRHLLDPNDLHGSHQRSIGTPQALSNVQRWVMSALALTTILHFSVGLVLASATLVDSSRLDARIGLNVLAALTGVIAVAAARAIHLKRFLSPWLALGLLPGIVGLVIVSR